MTDDEEYGYLSYQEVLANEQAQQEKQPDSPEPAQPASASTRQAGRQTLQTSRKMEVEKLHRELMRDEGVRLKPYRCSSGKLTIGVGRNLDDQGITSWEAMDLLDNDISRVVSELNAALPWWRNMPDPGQRALANMAFNLGLPRLMDFQRMIAALRAGDYETAADEALNSKWAEQQVGARAERVALLFREAKEKDDGISAR